ncbi:MAG: hypothetical protein ACTSV2_02340 [Candidatus Thorarchaeota archaeon]
MRVLFVLGSGGHSKRGLMLSKQMNVEKYYIVPFESELTKRKVDGRYFNVISPRFRAKDNLILTVIRTLFLFIHSLVILLFVRPQVLISTGSGLTYPVFMIGSFLRIKTVYIESPSRVYGFSQAGRMLYGKVTLWLSSWPELAKHEHIEYMGMIA